MAFPQSLAIQGGGAQSGGRFGAVSPAFGNFRVGGGSDYEDLIKVGVVALASWLAYVHFIKPKRKRKRKSKR